MNKAQLENDIKEMEARLASMKAELGKPVKSKVFVPEIYQKYWWITGSGNTCLSEFNDDANDKLRLALGNVYETETEAEKAREKKLATVRVLNKLRELEGDWVADWNDFSSRKYYIRYKYEKNTGSFLIDSVLVSVYGGFELCSTEEACQ